VLTDTVEPLLPPPDTAWTHADPVGVNVYVSEPPAWVIVSVSMPEAQASLKLPPLPTVEADKAWEEIRENDPPVVFESVTATLVAFTWSASATEPVAIVSAMTGEVRDIVSAEL
jgi:hypothetical protein